MAAKAVRKQSFKKEYTERWPCIVPSKKDTHSVRCELCSCDFSIAHGGATDINLHIGRLKHRKAAEACQGTSTIASMFQGRTDYSVIRAETMLTNFLIEHNIAFSTADHLTDLMKVMFPDSKIASKFASRRTKCTSIARTLGENAKENIIKKIREVPFSLSTDGSSDRGAEEQLYPIIVRYFDTEVQRVVGVLLQIATTKERSTGKNIFLLLDSVLKEHAIPWNKVVGFTADNAAVMMGSISGTAAFVKKANADVFINGCLCHRLHLTAEKGAKQLLFSPEDLLIPIYYYLEKSSKRQQVQKMCSVEGHSILKHICTRWLSMEKCLDRLLEQWIPLRMYFKEEAKTGQKRKGDVSSDQRQSKIPRKSLSSTSSAETTKTKSKSFSSSGRATTTKNPATKSSSSMGKVATKTPGKSSTISAKTTKAETKKSFTSSRMATTTKNPATKSSSSMGKVATKTPPKSSTSSATTFKASSSKALAKSSLSSTSSTTSRDFTKNIFFPSSSSSKPSDKSSSISKVGNVGENVKTVDGSRRVSSTSLTKAGEIHSKLTEKNKLCCMFLKHTIPLFNILNLELQEDAPQIHLLEGKLQKLLQDTLVRFVNPTVITSVSSLEQCPYKELSNQKKDDELIVGHSVRNLLDSGNLTTKDKVEFFSSVRQYFATVCDYIIKSFPLKNEVLLNASVADVTKRQNAKFSSVSFFVFKFHYMEENIDQLEIEFGQYQVDTLESVSLDQRADDVWVAISNIKNSTTGKNKYIHLPKIMLAILSLAHSNAEDERLFSLVRKNATDFRPNLSTNVLSDILTQKVFTQSRNVVCHKMTFTDHMLEKCKKAASRYTTPQQ